MRDLDIKILKFCDRNYGELQKFCENYKNYGEITKILQKICNAQEDEIFSPSENPSYLKQRTVSQKGSFAIKKT